MNTQHNGIDRFLIYRIGKRGFGYNRNLREWELYDMDEDGSIQDLHDRVKTKQEAQSWASLDEQEELRQFRRGRCKHGRLLVSIYLCPDCQYEQPEPTTE